MEDVAKTVEQLFGLYSDGKVILDEFSDTYKKLLDDQYFVAQVIDLYAPTPPDDYSDFDAFTARLSALYDDWHKNTHSALKTLNITRYTFIFNNPKEIKPFDPKLNLHDPPKSVEAPKVLLDRLSTQLDYLYGVASEYEETASVKNTDTTPKPTSPTYDAENKAIIFANQIIKFKNNAPFTPNICAIIFSKPDKLWSFDDLQEAWDDMYHYIGAKKPTDWHRVYEALMRLNERIRRKTSKDNFFIFDTESTKINPIYL